MRRAQDESNKVLITGDNQEDESLLNREYENMI